MWRKRRAVKINGFLTDLRTAASTEGIESIRAWRIHRRSAYGWLHRLSDITRLLSPKSQNLNVYQEPRASGMDWMRHLWETFVQNPLPLRAPDCDILPCFVSWLQLREQPSFLCYILINSLNLWFLVACCIFDCLLISFRHACVSST